MTKPKKTPAVTLADGALIDIPEDELLDPETVAIEEAMRTFGDTGAGVKVYKEGPGGYKDVTFLFGCLPSEWLDTGLERLQSEYGKGRYRIHMKGNDGRLMINKAINIEGLPKKESPAPQIMTQPAPDAMTTPFALALAEISKGQAAIAAMLERIATQAPPNPLHTLQGLKEVAEILRPAQAPIAPAGMDFKTTLDAAAQLMSLSKGFSAGNGEGDAPGDHAMKRGIDLVGKMIDAHLQVRAAPAVSAPAATRVAELPAPLQSTEGTPVMSLREQKQLAMLRIQLELANDSAATNEAPEAFAESVYDMLTDDILGMLATDPTWFEVCVKNVPDCANYPDWYARVRERLIAIAIDDGVLTPSAESDTVAEQGKPDGSVVSGDSGKTGTAPGGDV